MIDVRGGASFVVGFTLVAVLAFAGPRGADADGSAFKKITGVPSANPREGVQPNLLGPGYALARIVSGTDPLENPSGVITHFGLLSNQTKTEPDENTYLVLNRNPGGPTPGYDYGKHFLFQGHENGGGLAYVTRVNLDVTDPAHRITLLTPVGSDGKTGFSSIDGSTWNPHTQTLLFTQEAGASGGVIEITPEWPPVVRTLYGVLGRASYEGIHPDDRGNLLIVEDSGGTTVNGAARQPNSFVYRFVPVDPTDLSAGGALQALRVTVAGHVLTFNDPATGGNALGDVFSVYQQLLHRPGTAWPVSWVTVHDTAVDGFASFDANARAKAAGATPFKRPENAQFLPDSHFRTFFFDPTGDTNADAGNQPELAARGAWGSIFRVDLSDNGTGTIAIVVLGDRDHSSFDNLAFADTCTLLATEDRGDGLHEQLDILDSVWAFDICAPGAPAKRLLALGQDPEATGEDNEPTGLHISDGDPSPKRILGLSSTNMGNMSRWRWFFTQQHGANTVYEIVKSR
jgi:Alkaline phosphatase PhoX